jgi:ribosomal protein S18 acetylase RimI-like enzyme
VLERVQGQSVAAALMDWALARMRARGGEDAYLGVWQGNDRALRFYRRRGFEIVGEYMFPPIGPNPDPEFIMRKRLAG